MHITRESIFVGAIRALCVTFASLIGVILAIVIGAIALSSLSTPSLLPPAGDTTISVDADGNRHLLPSSSPAILRLNIHGIIGLDDLVGSAVENLLLDSREGSFANNRVKGVFLHIDTPGGTVTDADAIYRALLNYKAKYKVPVYAFVDGLCASGGMYVASACDEIFSTSNSTIGSIGVILGPTFNFSKAMETWGVQSLTLSQGKDKDMLNPFRPWVTGEDESLRAIIASLYQEFVDIVTNARPKLNKQQLIDVYGAQVYLGPKAEELGYIDHGHSNYQEALSALVKAAGIHENEAYQVLELSTPHNFLSEILQGKASLLQGKVTHSFEIGNQLPSSLSGKLLYYYSP